MFKKIIKILIYCYFAFIIFFVSIIFSHAFLSDSESSKNNTFTAATWEVIPEKSVVINELMWMGSVGHTADEWIELKNMTASNVDLSGWKITKNTGTESLMLTLPAGTTLLANDYYLISNYSSSNLSSALNVTPDFVTTSVDLSNTLLQIKLYKGAIDLVNLVDIAGNGGVPLAGSNGTNKQSMSRNSLPIDGSQISDWHTDTISNGTIYWDAIDGNYGTPKGPNI